MGLKIHRGFLGENSGEKILPKHRGSGSKHAPRPRFGFIPTPPGGRRESEREGRGGGTLEMTSHLVMGGC